MTMSGSVAERPGIAFHSIADRDDEFAGPVGEVRYLEVPTRRFVMVEGSGPPDQSVFAARIPALFATACSLRFALKKRGVLTTVRPLEGFWSTASGEFGLDRVLGGDRDQWRWSLGIALPDEASEEEIGASLGAGRERVEREIAASLRTEVLSEGRVAQVLYLGPYADERPTIERLHRAILDAGLHPSGPHHEIYLGDPRRSAPEKLRTLLRQPVG